MATQNQAVDDGMLPFRLLSVQAALRALALTLFAAVVPSVFLVRFGSDGLPLAFLLSAAFVPLAVLAYTFFERFLPVGMLVLGALLAVTVLIAWSWYATSGQARDWVAFLPMVLLSIPVSYAGRAADGQAGLLFSMRRQRKILPKVQAVSLLGFVVAGVFGPLAFAVSSERAVFGLSVLAAVLMTATAGLLVTNYAVLFSSRPEPDLQSRVSRSRFVELWADRLFRKVLASQFLMAVGGALIYFLFLDLLVRRFTDSSQNPTTSQLFTFLVIHGAVLQISGIVLSLIVSRRLLMRFGVRVGLSAQPVWGAAAALILLVLVARDATTVQALFAMTVAVRTLDLLLRRVATTPSFDAIEQLLPSRLRPTAKVVVAIGAIPLGGATAGALILLVRDVLDTGDGLVAVLILLVAGGSLVMATKAAAAYATQLQHRLAAPSLSELDITVDTAEAQLAADALLDSTDPGHVAAGLDVLGTVGGAPYDEALLRLLHSSEDPDVLLPVIERAAIERPDGAVSELVAQLAAEVRPDVSVAAMSALIACEPYSGGTVIQPLLKSEEPSVRYGAVRALLQGAVLRHHDPAMSALADLARSPTAQDRAAAGSIIGETGPTGATELLAELLADSDGSVRSAAIDAVGRLGLSGHAPAMLAALDNPATRRSAAKTLAAFGNGAVPSAADALARNDLPAQRASLMFGAFANAPTPGTTTLMVANVQHQNLSIRAAAIAALVGNPHLDSPRLALPAKVDRVLQPAIEAEANRAGELFRSVGLVPNEAGFGPLIRAITQLAESHVANVFALLAARYRLPTLQFIHQQIEVGGSNADSARELLGASAVERDQETVGLLLGQRTSSRPSQTYRRGSIAEVVERCDDDWITAAALYGLVILRAEDDSSPADDVDEITRPGGKVGRWERSVQEWRGMLPPPSLWHEEEPGRFRVLRRRNGKALPMAVVERVAVLRSCLVFRDVADQLVAEVAEISEQVTLGPKEVLASAGGVSEAFYVVVDGQLEASAGATNASLLSAGDTIDELSTFDGSPRPHTIRTVTAVELLRVNRSQLFRLLGQEPELAKGVMAALASAAAAQDGAGKETAAQDGAAKETAGQEGDAEETGTQKDRKGLVDLREPDSEGDGAEAGDPPELSPSADAP